jgi:type VI secretion system protein ImpF
MRKSKQHDRFVPPVMQAFRAAFRERDSSAKRDLRGSDEERIIAGRRSSPRNAVNEAVLKQELEDDLSALLNTVNLASAENLEGLDEVKTSILNYGIEDLTAISSESSGVADVGPRMCQVLKTYESRLIEGTISVQPRTVDEDKDTRIKFQISADMYATPADVPVEFVADVESYSGRMNVKQG